MESLPEKEQEVASNEFAAPWKDSDVILVAADVEFHVHRVILSFQSPVFEAMLNGHGNVREGKQNKITLEGKDPLALSDFLKLLYPSKTFENALNEENVATILGLADEYQVEAVITHCLSEVTITANNALSILPYASKYDKTRYRECINVAKKLIKCENLKESIPDLEPSVREEILVGKCELFEDALLRAKDNLIACMDKLSRTRDSRPAAVAVCCFSHEVEIHELYKTRECNACLVAYGAKFCDSAPICAKYTTKHTTTARSLANKINNKQLLALLQDIDDLLGANGVAWFG